MSARNGDRSRFHRERKQRIARRKRNRELLKGATPSNLARASKTAKPTGVSA